MKFLQIVLSFLFLFTSFPLIAKNLENVQCGFYPISLFSLNLNQNYFDITFYSWCFSKTGYKTNKNFEITNAVDYKINFHQMDKVGGLNRSTARFTAKVRKNWDLTNFPFDRQILKIFIEDNQNDETSLRYIADNKNSSLDQNFADPDIEVQGFNIETDTHLYTTNFGDNSPSGSRFSRIVLNIDVKRQGLRLFFNYFTGFFVAFFLSMLVYLIPIPNINMRGSLTLAAVFAAMGNKYVVDRDIPSSHNFILIDGVFIATIIIISITITLSVIFHLMDIKGQTRKSEILNRNFARVCCLSYILITGIFTAKAVMS